MQIIYHVFILWSRDLSSTTFIYMRFPLLFSLSLSCFRRGPKPSVGKKGILSESYGTFQGQVTFPGLCTVVSPWPSLKLYLHDSQKLFI